MYLNYYNLKTKPFRITCDPKFLWLGEKHKEALAMLRYGLLDNRGLVLLTGEAGTGKTLLINQFRKLLDKDTALVNLSLPKLKQIEFYHLFADRLKLPSPLSNKASFQNQFREYLKKIVANQQQIVLIIDEIQGAENRVLDDIRLLSDVEYGGHKVINIFLVGQIEINDVLKSPENKAFAQRITSRYHLEPLNYSETTEYILHRLITAGSLTNIFSNDAVEKIYECTAGIPRLINILCDNALLSGSVDEMSTIYADTIEACAKDIFVSNHQQHNVVNFRLPCPKTPFIPESSANTTITVDTKTKKEKRLSKTFIPTHQNKWFTRSKWIPVGTLLIFIVFFAFTLIEQKKYKNLSDFAHVTLDNHQEPPKLEDAPPEPISNKVIDNTVTLGWSQNQQFTMDFNQVSRIAEYSSKEIDLVIENLVNNPEKRINIYGNKMNENGSSISSQVNWRQMVNNIKSHLISRGAHPHQINMTDNENSSGVTTTVLQSKHYAVIDDPQSADFQDFNPDK